MPYLMFWTHVFDENKHRSPIVATVAKDDPFQLGIVTPRVTHIDVIFADHSAQYITTVKSLI